MNTIGTSFTPPHVRADEVFITSKTLRAYITVRRGWSMIDAENSGGVVAQTMCFNGAHAVANKIFGVNAPQVQVRPVVPTTSRKYNSECGCRILTVQA